MNNDQRLIPFLGGLVIGGAVGNGINNMPYQQQYYQPYYYPYPYYQNVPVSQQISYPNYTYNESQTNVIAPNKIISENPYPVYLNTDERSLFDLSYVPVYQQYKS